MKIHDTVDREWLERALELDPVRHAYAVWDLARHPTQVRFVSGVDEKTTLAYLLVWESRQGYPVVHAVGSAADLRPLLDRLPPRPLVVVAPPSLDHEIQERRGPATSVPILMESAPPGALAPSGADRPIRRLGREDSAELAALASADAHPLATAYAELDPREEVIYGGFDGGSLVAVARATVRLPSVWIVGGVFVRPSARGKGWGRAVVRGVANAAGGATVGLFVREDGYAARAVYRRLGFTELERRAWIDAGAGLLP